MRKIFTSLKSVVSAVVIAAMAFSVSCSYDDTAINDRVDKVEKDLAALTERVGALESKLQTEVESLKALIDEKVVIVDVTTGEDGTTTIKLSNGESITVVNECKYVACDHECTPCDCDNLQYRVVDGVLEVSADGETWVAINGVAADQVVVDVVLNEDGTATIELATGEKFTTIKAELIECEAASNGVYIPAGESKEIALSINDAVVDINIMNQPLGWSASIEEAPEAGDGGAIAPMPLAAGGKNYVVKINAPAASFKEAAKEGVVSVHFNTAAGACKVLSVNVNLAKLSFDIDKDGNITIVNSLIEMKRSMIWGDHEGFANFYIGIVYKSDYEDFDGNLQSIMNYGFPISFNQHDNLAFFNKEYEPGVYEEEVVTFTVQELFDEFKSVGMSDVSLEYGNEYVIYIAKINSAGEQDLNNLLVTADYKALQVAAEKVEGSETWNGADYKFTILGYDFAIIGYVPQREVDQLIEFGQCSDLDSFYDFYIANAENYGYPEIGSVVELGYEPWNEYLIPANQLSQMYKPIAPNTEYRLYALCFNYDDFASGRAFNHEDIYDFGTFTTTDLKAGDFDVIESTELVSWDAMGVKANIYLTDAVQLSYYKSFDGATLDPASRIEEILADAYFKGGSEIAIYEFVGDATEIYVGVIAVNANGEYAYEEVVFKKNATEEPETQVASAKASLVTDTTFAGFNPYDVTFSFENGDQVLVRFNTLGTQYLHLGNWQTDNWQEPHYISQVKYNGEQATITACNVAYENDAYVVTMSVFEYTNYATLNYTFTGAIEGLNAPEACDCLGSGDVEEPGTGDEPADDGDWTGAIELTNISMYKQTDKVLGWSANFCFQYTLSDATGDNAITILACDYFFSTSWLEPATYAYTDPYFANNANPGDYKFAAYEVKVNGEDITLSYDNTYEGTLVITRPDPSADNYTFKCAVPDVNGNIYKFVTNELTLLY